MTPPLTKTLTLDAPYLVLPIDRDKKREAHTVVTVSIDGRVVRTGRLPFPDRPEDAYWYATYHLAEYAGKEATVTIEDGSPESFELVRMSDGIPGAEHFYTEPWRPQFHYTPRTGWVNDPNGMVYHDGVWHFFYQHNPLWHVWGNMTWGHATSRDLLHWEQQPDKLHHRVSGKGEIFSGGGTVDTHNSAGFGKNALVKFFTDTEAGESFAYSTDGGKTLIPYSDNPVIGHDNHPEANPKGKPSHRGRDPKVIWYAYDENDTPLNDRAGELGGHWVMCVYIYHRDEVREDDTAREIGHYCAIYTSTDLKAWNLESQIEGYFECVDLFKLPVGDRTRWILFGGDARYAIGSFDGRTFTPGHEGKHRLHYGPFYASQTFENAPEGRRVQIGWLRIDAPEPPYSQHFSIPYELTLTDTADGVRMRANPIAELEQLRERSHHLEGVDLEDGVALTLPVGSDLLDVTAVVEPGDVKEITLALPGREIVYNAEKETLGEAPLKPVDGILSLRVLADRILTETIGNDGEVCLSSRGDYATEVREITLTARGESARLRSLDVHEMNSIWS